MDYDGYEHCLCVRQRGNWFNGVIGEGLSHSIGVRINCYFHLEVEIFFRSLFFYLVCSVRIAHDTCMEHSIHVCLAFSICHVRKRIEIMNIVCRL